MNARLIVCLALVAMAVPAFANDGKGAGLSLGGSVSGSLSVKKDLSIGAPAAAVPNPSAPAADDKAGAKASLSLSAPVLDVQIKKVPIVTVAEAPCKNVCKDVCSISLEKTCNKVPVTTKKCETVSKPTTKRMCHKKCTVNTPAIEMPSKDTPAMPNPSAPVDAAKTIDLSAGVEAKASASVSAGKGQGLDLSKSGSVSVSLGKGRKLNGLLLPLAAKAAVAKAVVDKVKGALDCEEVCEDVASTETELQCKDVTNEVEKCFFSPKKTCNQECLCIPMKSVSVNIPKKPLSISFSKDASADSSLSLSKDASFSFGKGGASVAAAAASSDASADSKAEEKDD